MQFISNVSAIQKKQRIIKYIKSKRLFEKHQEDTVELDSRITQDNTYPYLLTIVDHFSMYGFAYAIKNKKAETIRDHMVQAFVISDLTILHTDNGKEFVNRILNSWLENRGINHILGGKYHPQSQGAVESFNKTIQKFLNEAYTNSVFNEKENEWSLPVVIGDFLYYNNKRIHFTTKMIPRDFLFNFKDKNIIDEVIINNESSRNSFCKKLILKLETKSYWFHRLLNYQINELDLLKKREKPMKGSKEERHEIYSIQEEIIKKGLYYCIIEVIHL